MDFDLNDEQRAFVATVKEFATREIAPGAAARDRDGTWFAEGWRKMAELGLLGLQFPEEYGGSAASVVTTAAAFQAFTAGGADAGIALSWIAHSVLAGTAIWLFGTPSQKATYLSPIARGQHIAGYGLTEPSAGSDAASLRTTAIRRGDRWILNGSKMFITNAPVGDIFVVFASEDVSLRSRGITAFIVERRFAGFSSGKELDKMGNRTSPTGELVFSDCEVPLENVLGQPRQGFAIAKAALEWERFLMMAHSVGTMEAVISESLRYARQREQFGKPIAAQPAIQLKLADMQVMASVGELFVRRVAWLKDHGRPTPVESSTCKIFCAAAVMSTASQAVQVQGGYGYMRESAVERAMRDARLAAIGGGTSEIQRQLVAQQVLAGQAYEPGAGGQGSEACGHTSDDTGSTAATGWLDDDRLMTPGPQQQARSLRGTVAVLVSTVEASPDRVTEAVLAETARWSSQLEHKQLKRLFGSAAATGIAKAALNQAVDFARGEPERAETQLLQQRVADIKTQFDGAWLAVLRAATAMDAGADAAVPVLEAHIFALEAALFCTDAGLLSTGRCSREALLRLALQARKLALEDGTPDQDRLTLAGLMLGSPTA